MFAVVWALSALNSLRLEVVPKLLAWSFLMPSHGATLTGATLTCLPISCPSTQQQGRQGN